ncbi:MAG: hypothetical protein R6V04_08510, partial [bacterium]
MGRRFAFVGNSQSPADVQVVDPKAGRLQPNTFESFKKGKLEDLFYQKLIERMDTNDETSNKLLNNKELANAILFEYLAKVVFEKVNV